MIGSERCGVGVVVWEGVCLPSEIFDDHDDVGGVCSGKNAGFLHYSLPTLPYLLQHMVRLTATESERLPLTIP